MYNFKSSNVNSLKCIIMYSCVIFEIFFKSKSFMQIHPYKNNDVEYKYGER